MRVTDVPSVSNTPVDNVAADVTVQAEPTAPEHDATPPIPALAYVTVPSTKPKELYDKSVQTSGHVPSMTRSVPENDDIHSHTGGVGSESSDELRARIIAELEEERKHLDREIAEEKRQAELALEVERARGLPDTALKGVLESSPFLDFLNQSSKIVQRALADSYDYLRDYTISAEEGDLTQDSSRVRLLGNWSDERWTRGRSVTAVDWSPKVRQTDPHVFQNVTHPRNLYISHRHSIVP